MKHYTLSRNGTKTQLSHLDWLKTHVSSVLRSFCPHVISSMRVLPELETRTQLQFFLNACLTLIKNNINVPKVNDFIKSTHNYLVGKVIKYLLEKCKLEDCKNFINSCKCDVDWQWQQKTKHMQDIQRKHYWR